MPFRDGLVSYARFRVEGGPHEVTDELLALLAEHIVVPPSIGTPPDHQAGWTAGAHLLDHEFSVDHCAAGRVLLIGLRVDQCRVPPELSRAYRAEAEARNAPVGGIDGGLSRAERRAAKEEAEEKCRRELASGMHRRSHHYPVLWDTARGVLLSPLSSDAAVKALNELLGATFGAAITAQDAGTMAMEILSSRGDQRAAEDLKPGAYASPPADAPPVPLVPWAAGELRWIGNEFLLWLWSSLDGAEPILATAKGEVGLSLDRVLDMECAWGMSGRQALHGAGPWRWPEAHAALRLGKWPRRIGLLLARESEGFELTLQGDRFRVSAARLPAPEDAPASAREVMERRIDAILSLDETLLALFEAFVIHRSGARWSGERERLRRWIQRSASRGVPRPSSLVEVLPAAGAMSESAAETEDSLEPASPVNRAVGPA